MNDRISSQATMPDVQGSLDDRQIAIHRVGIRGVRHPLKVRSRSGDQATVADWHLTVALPADQKGTHMSRFVALLGEHSGPLDLPAFAGMAQRMLDLLEASEGELTARFPLFLSKRAPVSGVESLMDYSVVWRAEPRRAGGGTLEVELLVPLTSLCPCSKKISDYGAHNQRSHVTVKAVLADTGASLDLEAVIAQVEAQGSCELWGLLKRSDEKYVTERAYDNPKFVEDLVRDVALVLQRWPGVLRYEVEAENFESIHNHSAYAHVIGQGAA
jgi:GTP cyclohydrolase I